MTAVLVLLLALQPSDRPKIRLRAWRIQTTPRPDGTIVTFLQGNVRVAGPGFELLADRALAWKNPGSEAVFDEVYLEGAVRARWKGAVLQAEQVFVDLPRQRVFATEVAARGRLDIFSPKSEAEPVGPAFHIRAARVRRATQERTVLEDASISTCMLVSPDFEVRLTRVDVVPSGETEPPWLEGEDLSFWFFGIPIFYFPYAGFTPGEEFPLRRFHLGQKSRWGWFAFSDWGVTWKKDRARRRFDAVLEADWRETRGYAAGLDALWRLPDLEGWLDTYALFDHGPDPDSAFDRQFLPLESHRRARLRFWNRWEMTGEFRLDLELSRMTDRNLLPEFFRSEFLEGKEQETLAYLRWRRGNLGGFVQGKFKINSFLTVREDLPRGELWWVGQPILGPISYSTVTQGGNLRLSPDDDLAAPSHRTWRGDTQQELYAALDLGPVQLRPFCQVAYTAYENDRENEPADRATLTAGLSLFASLWGIHPMRSETLGMDGLRHIVEVRARAASNLEVTRGPEHFFFMDDRDSGDEFDEVSFGIRQRFQTRLREGTRAVSHEFLEFGASMEYYPSSRRDTGRVNFVSTVYPFDPPALFPSVGRNPERRRFSNVHWDVSLRPRGAVSFAGMGEVDPRGAEEMRRLEMRAAWGPLAVQAAHTYLRFDDEQVSADASWQITEKWRLGGGFAWDLKDDRVLRRRIEVARDFHDFFLNFRISVDRRTDDVTLGISILPKPPAEPP